MPGEPRQVVEKVFTLRDDVTGETGMALWLYDPVRDRHAHVPIAPATVVDVERIGGLDYR